jgi:hypothetical protein
MLTRFGLRARTDVEVIARHGHFTTRCRGIEVSPTGILLDRGPAGTSLEDHLLIELELRLPERVRVLHALARTVRSVGGNQQALRFVEMSDADRLTLAEHMDTVSLAGAAMS